jgi:hypothetical protein
MESEKIDLSPLDPTVDLRRWNDLVNTITRRAIEARQRRLSVTYQLLAWARPAVAMAAAVALVVIAGASLSRFGSRTEVSSAVKPALILADWAVRGEAPSTATMIEVLGGARGSK